MYKLTYLCLIISFSRAFRLGIVSSGFELACAIQGCIQAYMNERCVLIS